MTRQIEKRAAGVRSVGDFREPSHRVAETIGARVDKRTHVGHWRRGRIAGRLAVAICGVCALLPSAAAAQTPKPSGSPPQPPAIQLFDGKTLAGWKKSDFVDCGEVKVDEGAIVMGVGGEMTGITTTRHDFPRKDFVLTYEARRLAGEDFFAAATFPVGESYLTFVNGGWGGSITGLSSLNGMDASQNETGRFVKYEDKKWYQFQIRVTAKMIRCFVDGKEVAAVNHEDLRLGTRLESRPSQPLGFSTWNTAGAVRDITIRPLTPPEVAAVDKTDP